MSEKKRCKKCEEYRKRRQAVPKPSKNSKEFIEKYLKLREEREGRIKQVKSSRSSVPKIYTLLFYPDKLKIPTENVPEGFQLKKIDIHDEVRQIKESLLQFGTVADVEIMRAVKGGFYIEIDRRIPNWVADNFRKLGIQVTERVQT